MMAYTNNPVKDKKAVEASAAPKKEVKKSEKSEKSEK